MAKRNRRGEARSKERRSRRDTFVEDVPLAEAARTRYLNYALSVITSRALPDVRDGLKPVQRRILYAMWARPAPHGRQPLHQVGRGRRRGDEDLSPARRPVDLRRPGADGPAVQPAAHAGRGLRQFRLDRRRSARRDAVHRVPADADRPDAAERAPRADRRLPAELCLDRPRSRMVLPAQFPNLLVNGASGIAVGMATNIPPHNLKEVCNALDRACWTTASCRWSGCSKYIQGPDFPTGGVILNTAEEIRQIYATGQGAIKLRGTYEPHPERANAVLITSIPYGIEKDALVERIGELIGKGQVPQLDNVKDLSTDDIRIVLELRPGLERRRRAGVPVQEHAAADQLQRQPDLPAAGRGGRGGRPQPARPQDDPPALPRLPAGGRHPPAAVTSCKNLLERIHILEGFAIVFNNLDEAIQIIRASDGKADAAPKLIAPVRAHRDPGRRRPRDQALPPGQARDQRHPRGAEAEAEAGRRDQAAARRRAGAVGDHQGRAQADRQDLRRAPADPDRGSRRPRWSSARKTTSSTRTPG